MFSIDCELPNASRSRTWAFLVLAVALLQLGQGFLSRLNMIDSAGALTWGDEEERSGLSSDKMISCSSSTFPNLVLR